MNKNIEQIFNTLDSPKSLFDYSCNQFNESNLWIVKDNNGNCGFLIENANDSDKLGEYKNLDKKKFNEFQSKKNILKNVLMIIHNENVVPEVFSESLNVYFEKNIKVNYTVNDVKKALDEVEAITKKIKNKLNEIIGVWGEFIVLRTLLENAKSDKIKSEIINGWESPDGRTLIDFNLVSLLTHIEVKTTTLNTRIHHISSTNQLLSKPNWNGYLASICIKQNTGVSCNDLRLQILNLINENQKVIFNQRVLIRGKHLCNDSKYIFEINKTKEIRYYRFINVPIPEIKNNTVNVKWDAILEEIDFLNKKSFFKSVNL